jgi:translocation and assembly module TamB
MRRVWINAAYVTGIVLGAFVTASVLLLVFANTTVGQDSMARLVNVLTGGEVKVTELRGRFPGSLRASRIDIGDKDGVWLIFEDVAVDWAPLSLLRNHVEVERLSVDRAQILRLSAGDDTESGGGELPRIDIHALAIARLDTSASVSRTAMELSAEGDVHYASLQDLSAKLAVMQRNGSGSYRIDATMRDGIANGVISVEEKPNGLIAGLLGLSDIGSIGLSAKASGPRDANRIAVMVDAGKLHATGAGTIDLLSKRADVNFTAQAPEMALRPDLSWDSLAIEGRASGALSELFIAADAKARNLKAANNAVTDLAAHLEGEVG